MKKIRLVVFAIVLSVLAYGMGYCDEMYGGYPLQTVDGTVVSVDARGSKLILGAGVNMTFPITPDTKFLDATYANEEERSIEMSGIDKGDYVSVEFYTDDSKAVKTTRVILKFDKSENRGVTPYNVNPYEL